MENEKTKELRERVKRFIIRVIKLTDRFPRTTAAYRIVGQLIDATCSVGANLTEAHRSSFKGMQGSWFLAGYNKIVGPPKSF